MGEEREEKQDVAAVGSSPDHAAWEGKALLAMQGVIVREETRCIRPWTAAVIVSSLADSRAAKDFLVSPQSRVTEESFPELLCREADGNGFQTLHR